MMQSATPPEKERKPIVMSGGREKGVLPGVSEREAALEETAGERTALLPEKAEDEAGFERADDADTA